MQEQTYGPTKKKLILSRFDKLKAIFRRRVGRSKAITLRELFRLLYPATILSDRYKVFFQYCELQRMLSLLRKKTIYMVVPDKDKTGMVVYYIPRTAQELYFFHNKLRKQIAGFNRMIVRSEKFVEEQVWKRLDDE